MLQSNRKSRVVGVCLLLVSGCSDEQSAGGNAVDGGSPSGAAGNAAEAPAPGGQAGTSDDGADGDISAAGGAQSSTPSDDDVSGDDDSGDDVSEAGGANGTDDAPVDDDAPAADDDTMSDDDTAQPHDDTSQSDDDTSGSGGEGAGTEPDVERGTSVFDRDVLHVVSIDVAPEELSALDVLSDTRIPATFSFDGVELTQVGVRNKGQTSFQPSSGKLGFSVKFDEFVEDQKLDGLKKLLLNNTTQDPTWCNETLTYETYRRAGIPAPRVAFAVVTLNGEPKGIYSIGEAINEQFLSRHYGKDMNDGNLYEGPWDFSDSVDSADLKDEVEEGRTRDDLRALQEVVLSEPDEGYVDRLSTLLDVDQFLLGYAIDAVTVAWDGYSFDAWNYYLYHYPGDDRFLFLPTGANWPYFRDAADAAPTVDPRELVSLWGGGKDPASFLSGARVQRIESFDARFETLVRDVTHDVFDVSALHADFDRIDRVLHSAQDPDEATLRDLETFDAYKSLAYDFVEGRKAYLVEQFPR